MSIFWDINKILPYQRCFNLINGERSIGKSYTTQKFIIDRAIKKGQEFVYMVRTQDEKKHGIFSQAFSKVIGNEFKGYRITTTSELMVLETDGFEPMTLGYCLALTEAIKIKKKSFPNVKYLMFDEYMLEEKQNVSYVNGWKEPDIFLSIYHTIDREEDRVICFLLGNNTSFYNPYHLHPAFKIPKVQKGEIWYSENVLFQWATGSDELHEHKAKSKFIRMIDDTAYGEYAFKGNYVDDNFSFVAIRTPVSTYVFTFSFNGEDFGVWSDRTQGIAYISNKIDPSCKINFALTIDDHKENTMLTKDKRNTVLQWLAKNFKLGNVRYESMEIKKKAEEAIILIL
jgi:hypothetical protein